MATARKVKVDFALAAAKAFLEGLAPRLPEGHKFRFVFCSGRDAEWDQEKHLMYWQDTRRLKVCSYLDSYITALHLST